MTKESFKYLKNLLLLTTATALVAYLSFSTFLKEVYLPVFWFLLGFFFVIHAISHFVMVFNEKKKKMSFANAYLLSFSMKFLGYIAFLIIYYIRNKENMLFFGISLFVLYLIFTFFEVRVSIAFSKRTANKIEKSN
jgi:hypothetical protein